ncbi:WD repeat-containing protein 61 [Smittium mucronatum]|uniref:WD repeat-containing protein 61 n=1 Tax=Smittium mucronatum TaxID=133383 RepID=A0A1R0GQP9_9FUNG|nr:WD repeat-containing protein 61 [Smittium mucronatum]
MFASPSILLAHEDTIWDVLWAKDSKVITCSVDETIKIWDAKGCELVGVIKGYDYAIVSIDLNKDDTKILATTMGHCLEVWDFDSLKLQKRIRAGPMDAWKAKFINNDKMAICGSDKGVLTLWDLDLEVSNKYDGSIGSGMVSILDSTKKQLINCVASGEVDSLVVAGNSVGNIYTFDLARSQLISEFMAHSDIVRDVILGKDNSLVYSCSDDKRIMVYDVRYKNAVMSLQGHDGWVMGISLCLDDRLLSSASSDSTCKLWDMRTRSCCQTLATRSSEVWDVSFERYSDAPRLVSVGDDRCIQFFNPISL